MLSEKKVWELVHPGRSAHYIHTSSPTPKRHLGSSFLFLVASGVSSDLFVVLGTQHNERALLPFCSRPVPGTTTPSQCPSQRLLVMPMPATGGGWPATGGWPASGGALPLRPGRVLRETAAFRPPPGLEGQPFAMSPASGAVAWAWAWAWAAVPIAMPFPCQPPPGLEPPATGGAQPPPDLEGMRQQPPRQPSRRRRSRREEEVTAGPGASESESPLQTHDMGDHVNVAELLAQEIDHARNLLVSLQGTTEEQRDEITGMARVWSDALASDSTAIAQVAAQTLLHLYALPALSDEVRLAARTVQDVLVLACSQECWTHDMGGQGIPHKLRVRIQSAFGDDDVPEDLLSRVGVAKYHLFNKGIKFGRRPKRKDACKVSMPAAGGESPS